MWKAIVLLAALLTIAASPNRYAEGQVWEYKARPQDTGSLVKIQKIEESQRGTIYHISLIGIAGIGELQHAPPTDARQKRHQTSLRSENLS